MTHKHGVRDVGAHYTIDQFTRQIKNDSVNKTTIIQYDHNSERLTFEIPLYVDGHAMTLCDLIEIHFINISEDGKHKNPGVYEVDDITAEGEKAVFTWLFSQDATQLAGSLNFFIVFKCTENGVTVYRWGTEIYKNLPVSEGMNNGEAVLTEYPDILAQWKAQLFSASDTAVLNVATAEANALAAIEAAGEAKKQSVLDSIPDEYEALSALADQNHRNKAGAIIPEAEGESIVLNDASDYPLQNLKVFGKSTQAGTPTPDAPVDIVSVENPVVVVCGKNFFDVSKIVESSTLVRNEDGSLTANQYYNNTQRYLKDLAPGLIVGQRYKLYLDTDGATFIYLSVLGGVWDHGYTFEITEDMLNSSVAVYGKYEQEVGSPTEIRSIQIALASETEDYEPYKGTKTVTLPHTLPGIPVSSGGNYTDANGQEWICDEVDLARGVYIQRTNRYTVNGSDIETWKISSLQSVEGATRFDMYIIGLRAGQQVCLCSHYPGTEKANKYPETCWCNSTGNASYFEFRIVTAQATTVEEIKALVQANPFDVVYALYTPIETPLSDAEINAFKALHSNCPNTVILNDSGAHMAVSYVADTKTYIDNKIKELMEEVTG